MSAAVSIGPCQGCGACLLTCPVHAIRPRAGVLIVLGDRCTGCGECVEICPVDAIAFDPPYHRHPDPRQHHATSHRHPDPRQHHAMPVSGEDDDVTTAHLGRSTCRMGDS